MKLAEITISNFKCIPSVGCTIRIDDIVVLIGQNNAGKSTILDAYEAFAKFDKELDLYNFHHFQDKKPVIMIAVFKEVTDTDLDRVGKSWAYSDATYGRCIKVKIEWEKAGEKGKKYSYNPQTDQFELGGMGGIDSLIKSRIPVPIRIRPTDSPEDVQAKVVGILKEYIKNKLKVDASPAKKALEEIDTLTETIFKEFNTAFTKVAEDISRKMGAVFDGSSVGIVPLSKKNISDGIGAESYVEVKEGTTSVRLTQTGTGLQRAFLWSALSAIDEQGSSKSSRKKASTEEADTCPPKILLIDEPEAFLHPPTIRNAREALYDFALNNADWQVIATTHSPIFIDLSKNHTTIVRVDKQLGASKFISTDDAKFSSSEKENLKVIRASNPLVNEFFFYDDVFLVEGETEQVTLYKVAAMLGRDIHVINCFGKGNIPLFARILNHFKTPYTVIHDSDRPKVKRKGKEGKSPNYVTNPMWTVNKTISDVVNQGLGRVALQIPNFEGQYFGEEYASGKVDEALAAFENSGDQDTLDLIDSFTQIIDGTSPNFYKEFDELETRVRQYVSTEALNTDPLWEMP